MIYNQSIIMSIAEPIINSRTMQPGRQQLMQLPQQQDDAVFGHPPVIRRMDDLDFSWACEWRHVSSIQAVLANLFQNITKLKV